MCMHAWKLYGMKRRVEENGGGGIDVGSKVKPLNCKDLVLIYLKYVDHAPPLCGGSHRLLASSGNAKLWVRCLKISFVL